jgi:hypothetical protein
VLEWIGKAAYQRSRSRRLAAQEAQARWRKQSSGMAEPDAATTLGPNNS